MEGIYNMDALMTKIDTEKGVLLYFSSDSCSVCKVLKPKVAKLLHEKFPLMRSLYVDTGKSPVISGQFMVFTIPTILIFFEGRSRCVTAGTLACTSWKHPLRGPTIWFLRTESNSNILHRPIIIQ